MPLEAASEFVGFLLRVVHCDVIVLRLLPLLILLRHLPVDFLEESTVVQSIDRLLILLLAQQELRQVRIVCELVARLLGDRGLLAAYLLLLGGRTVDIVSI